MAKIVSLDLWKDVGYTEGDYEIPAVNIALPLVTADISISDTIIPSKSGVFSKMQIKRSWEELRYISYLKATYELSSGNETVIYGWVDSVTLLSDSEDAPMCQIDWHIDYWRTYKGSAVFGKGLVKRKSEFNAPQMSQPIYWEMDEPDVLKFEGGQTTGTGNPLYWLYITYLTSVGTSSGSTYIEYYCAPLAEGSDIYITDFEGLHTGYTLGLGSLLGGTWEENLGLDPSKIKGAWILPIPPCRLTGSGTQSSPYCLERMWYTHRNSDQNSYFYYLGGGTGSPTDEFYYDFTEKDFDAVVTDDLGRWVITGFDGEIVGELPWGLTTYYLTARVCISANSCYMQIRESTDSHAVGQCYTIPAPVVDTVENAMSTYNYTGQRAYDMEMRQIQVYSQIAGSSTNAIGGAIAGGTSGGGGVGAAAGAAVGLTTSLVGAGLNQHVFNPMIQEAKDALVSKQSSGLLLSGATIADIIYHGKTPRLAKLKADEVSILRWKSKTARYGFECNVNYDSCQSLVTAGGPLQITDLTVSGDIPSEAKVYIKSLFARGVNIIIK